MGLSKGTSSFDELILSLKANYLGEQNIIKSLYRLHEISLGSMAPIQSNLIHTNQIWSVLEIRENTSLGIPSLGLALWECWFSPFFYTCIDDSPLTDALLLILVTLYQISLSGSHFSLFKMTSIVSFWLQWWFYNLSFRGKTYVSYF